MRYLGSDPGYLLGIELPTAGEKLSLAQRHLNRVQAAGLDAPDIDDLSLYGFYCMDEAVEAAALHVGIKTTRRHWEKATVARELHKRHGLPDVADLLRDLNDARKAVAYGDVEAPDLDGEDVANEIENYVEAVEELVGTVD